MKGQPTKPIYIVLGVLLLFATVNLAMADEAPSVAKCSSNPAWRDSGHVAMASTAALQPLLTTPELLVGPNRFAFGLARAGRLVEGATIVVRLYAVEGTSAFLSAEAPAVFYPVARNAQETSPTPARGSPAPRSHNLIASDVNALREMIGSGPSRLQRVDPVGGSLVVRDRLEVVHFPKPGTYLVICGIQSHFVNDGMCGFVKVLR